MKKSSEEVRINPRKEEDISENEKTSFNVKFDLDETHDLSEEQRKQILEVLLTGSRQEKEPENGIEEEVELVDLQRSTRVIILAVGMALGALIFFLVSIL